MSSTKSAHISTLVKAIENQIGKVLSGRGMSDWVASTRFKTDDVVIFNNSVLHREGSKKVKSKKYLCVKADSNGELSLPAFVIEHTRINVRFKHIPARHANFVMEALDVAVEEELSRVGVIVNALIARIGSDEPCETQLDGRHGFNVLRYEPTLGQLAEVNGQTISVQRFDDLDSVWQAVEAALPPGDNEDLANRFEAALNELREAAGRPVDVHDIDSAAPSILSEVMSSLDDQTDQYRVALTRHTATPTDNDALNELLRLAYNFADGANHLLTLVIGLSDLKPLLFWLTVASQSELADSFGNLPFAIVGKAKPSLGEYQSVISGARNRSFHDVFAFGRPFHIRLTSDAFKTPELRLFQEYARRTRPVLDYEDRELVDLLAGFTRAAERPVPSGFWEANLEVMKGVSVVAKELQRALLATAGR